VGFRNKGVGWPDLKKAINLARENILEEA